MNPKARMMKFKRFGLTNAISLYNEDSMTAQQLVIEGNRKIAECLSEIERMWVDIEDIKASLLLTYTGDKEELEISIDEALEEVKKQVDASYRCIIDEDSMTALEQAGSQAAAINECIKAVNMMVDIVKSVKEEVGLSYNPTSEELTIKGGVE